MNGREVRTRAKLKERCATLADIVAHVGPVYDGSSSSEDQRNFIETMIGAAVWYLPEVEECWTGKMSLSALKSHHSDLGITEPKLTKDHEYPRKVAAAELLVRSENKEIDATALLELYTSRYGKYNYVTPRENKALTKYQKKGVFSQPADAYRKAGIRLVSLTRDELKRVRKRESKVIEDLLSSISSSS